VTFTDEAWTAVTDIRRAIDTHPLVTGLHDGTLDREVFVGYLAQDAQYLAAWARVLASCATQAPAADETAFWARRAHDAVAVERALHDRHLGAARPVEPSPTCLGYSSYLGALSAQGAYPVLVAGLLPCFWIYEDIGRRFTEQATDPSGHPYRDWIATYGDPAFTEATDRVRLITDRLAQESGPLVRERMLAAFVTASRYEWMFWDAAWRSERWPV